MGLVWPRHRGCRLCHSHGRAYRAGEGVGTAQAGCVHRRVCRRRRHRSHRASAAAALGTQGDRHHADRRDQQTGRRQFDCLAVRQRPWRRWPRHRRGHCKSRLQSDRTSSEAKRPQPPEERRPGCDDLLDQRLTTCQPSKTTPGCPLRGRERPCVPPAHGAFRSLLPTSYNRLRFSPRDCDSSTSRRARTNDQSAPRPYLPSSK